MRRRQPQEPTAPEPTPMEAYRRHRRVDELLREANRLRETGVNLHRHEIMDELEEVSGNPMADAVFVWIPDDYHLSFDEVSNMVASLLAGRAPGRATTKD